MNSIFAKRSEANKINSNLHTRKIKRSGSNTSSVDRILYLQRTIGNQAVSRLIRSKALQAKLRIGQPGDVYEQEADRVADEVMRMPEPEMQRQVEPEEEEEEIFQTKPLVDQITPVVQRQVEEEEEEMLQAKSREDATSEVSYGLESQINAIKGGGRPLGESERVYFEPRFGADFGQVQVHTDGKADVLNRSLNARAFTTGQDIFFRQGEYNPNSSSGRGLLAHELTHVFQQMGTKRAESIIQREVTESISNCPQRVDGEVEASHTSPFRLRRLTDSRLYLHTWLVDNFANGSPEFLLEKVADFGALVAPILSRLRAPYTYGARLFHRHLRVYGYADCTGRSDANTSLRLGRADAFWGLFPMQDRIIGREGRPVGTYIESNATPSGRARNRSVRIREVGRESPPQTRTLEEIEQERGQSRSQLQDYITRAQQRLGTYPGISDVQRRRINGFLSRVRNPDFNDEYLTGRLAQNYYAQNLYGSSPSPLLHHLETTLVDSITHSLSFDDFMDRIVSLDVTISESVRVASRIYNIHGENSAAAIRLADWIREHQNDRNSVYNLYR